MSFSPLPRTYRGWLRGSAALLVATLAAATVPTLGLTATPVAAAAGAGSHSARQHSDLSQDIHGTWLVTSTAPSDPAILQALAMAPGITGLSVWVGWDKLVGGPAQIQKVLGPWAALAATYGLKLAVRFVAGQYTPASVFAAGAASTKAADGQLIPLPWDPATGGPNVVFEQQYQAFVSQLAAWCEQNGVVELHLPWYGYQYAELYNGPEIENAPGYTYQRLLTGYEDLFNIGAAFRSSSLAVEYPLTGAGDIDQLATDLGNYISAQTPAYDPTLYVQLNGWGMNNDNGLQEPFLLDRHTTRRGLQENNGDSGAYNWAEMFDTLEAVHADYDEIWLNSFSLPNAPQLAAAIDAFAATTNQLPSTSSVGLSAPASAAVGSKINLTAAVSTPQGIPSGTVTFSVGGVPVKTVELPYDLTAQPSAGRTETVQTGIKMPNAGSQTVTASYSGDASTDPSSASTAVSISQRATHTTTTYYTGSVTAGTAITLHTSVSNGTWPPPGGTVTITENGTAIGSGTLSSGGAALATGPLSAGEYQFVAVYGGDQNDAGSSSPPFDVTVTNGMRRS